MNASLFALDPGQLRLDLHDRWTAAWFITLSARLRLLPALVPLTPATKQHTVTATSYTRVRFTITTSLYGNNRIRGQYHHSILPVRGGCNA